MALRDYENNQFNYTDYDQDLDTRIQQQMYGHLSEPAPVSQERTLGGTLKDVGVSVGKGIVGTGEAAVGLADLITPGNLGQAVEDVGIDLEGAQEYLSEQYSPAQQQAFEEVEDVKGFLPKLGAMVQRPSTIGHAVVESVPSMVAGGVIGRGLGLAARGLGATSKAIPLVTGAAGEGTIAAGQMQENVRRQSGGETTLGQQAKAIGAGLGTGAFGILGGKLARRLGINDVDTMLAGGNFAEKSNKGVMRRILEGGISEGAFEELPQSMQEQVWTNAALGQPLDQGVGEAGAAGLLAGAVMGGGTNIFNLQEIQNFTPDEQQAIKDEVQNINVAEQTATTPEEQEKVQKRKNILVDIIQQRQQETDSSLRITEADEALRSDEDIRAEKQAIYDQLWKLPVDKSAEESAQSILDQRPFTDVEQNRKDIQRQIDETYLPAEEEVDRINVYRQQEARQNNQPEPVPLRSTDIITKDGKPYERRNYLEGLISNLPNRQDFEIIEVPLETTYNSEKARLQQKLNESRNQEERTKVLNELNALEYNIEELKPEVTVGYVGRLTDDALDPRREEQIWKDETRRYPSETSYWQAQKEALIQQQAQAAQRPYDKPIGPETQDVMVRRAKQAVLDGIDLTPKN